MARSEVPTGDRSKPGKHAARQAGKRSAASDLEVQPAGREVAEH